VQREKPKPKKIAAAPRTTASERRQLDSGKNKSGRREMLGAENYWHDGPCSAKKNKMKAEQESAASQKQIERERSRRWPEEKQRSRNSREEQH
jgi:hypothetical protein